MTMKMKTLSPVTKELLIELHKPDGASTKWIGGQKSQIELLDEIGRAGEPIAMRSLAPLLSITPSAVSRKASEVIDVLLRLVPPNELPWLDQELRLESYGPGFPCLSGSEAAWPGALKSMSISAGCELSLMAFASMTRNGYVREAAVRNLNEFSTGEELPFLLLRLNDWVGPVQELAAQYVRDRLQAAYAGHFVNNLGLMTRIWCWQRVDQKETTRAICDLLKSQPCKKALSAGLTSPNRIVQKQCFLLAYESEFHDKLAVCRLALTQRDTAIRMWAARLVVANQDGTFAPLLPLMRHDPYMPIRREALNGYMKLSETDAIRELQDGVLDSRASLRDFCRFWLGKRGVTDFQAIYRQAFVVTGPSAAVIAGLGEVGDASDIPVMKAALASDTISVRRAAVPALMKLAGAEAIPHILPHLSDVSLSVCRVAYDVLLKQAERLSVEELWLLYRTEPRPIAKMRLLKLLGSLDLWTVLPYLIQAYGEADQESSKYVAEQIHTRLGESFNPTQPWQSIAGPNREQLQHIGSALGRYLGNAGNPLAVTIKKILPRMPFPQEVSVLVVDDDETSVRLIRLELEHFGFLHTVGACSGQEAILRLQENAGMEWLVTLNLHMPDLDGWAVMEYLRDVYAKPVVVIMITGDASEAVRERFSSYTNDRLLAAAVLSKPWEAEDLEETVRWALMDTSKWAQVSASKCVLHEMNQLDGPKSVPMGVLIVHHFDEAGEYLELILQPKGLGPYFHADCSAAAIKMLQKHGKVIRLMTLDISKVSAPDAWRTLDFLRETRVDPIALVMTTDDYCEEHRSRFESYESACIYPVRLLGKSSKIQEDFSQAVDRGIRAVNEGRGALYPRDHGPSSINPWLAPAIPCSLTDIGPRAFGGGTILRRITDTNQLEQAVHEILQHECDDAANKTREAWYWGNTGGRVSSATSVARRAIASVALESDLHVYLDRLDEALAAGLAQYRSNYDDEDGFGVATLHGIRREVKALHELLPPRGSKNE